MKHEKNIFQSYGAKSYFRLMLNKTKDNGVPTFIYTFLKT
jgi:hypothetical protein